MGSLNRKWLFLVYCYPVFITKVRWVDYSHVCDLPFPSIAQVLGNWSLGLGAMVRQMLRYSVWQKGAWPAFLETKVVKPTARGHTG